MLYVKIETMQLPVHVFLICLAIHIWNVSLNALQILNALITKHAWETSVLTPVQVYVAHLLPAGHNVTSPHVHVSLVILETLLDSV
jgi:hypothetical protein